MTTKGIDIIKHELGRNNPNGEWNLKNFLRCSLISFVVMITWPLLGFALSYRWFDNPDETLLMFGGITCLPIALISLVLSSFEAFFDSVFFDAVILSVWFAVLLLPNIVMSRKNRSLNAIVFLVILQSLFAFAQTAMGILIVLGKGC